MSITLSELRGMVSGSAIALRCVTEYQPTGGLGSKIFPPTYEGKKYATEKRLDPKSQKEVKCVLLDSVQSQANRMELALLKAHRDSKIALPLLVVKFNDKKLIKQITVTSLDAPHRIADAIFRDCTLNGKKFRDREVDVLSETSAQNATSLFEWCPTALVFGMWDSAGKRGGMGAKFQRAIVSEIVGYDAVFGANTISRIDPLEIRKEAASIYITKDGDWTLDKSKAENPKKQLKPSEIIHGNVTPSIDLNDDGENVGGITMSRAQQTTTISLAVLRRLRFPLDGLTRSDVDLAAQTALTALALSAGTLARVDVDLRSRCHLWATHDTKWEVLDRPGERPHKFTLTPDESLELLNESVSEAKKIGLPWGGETELKPIDNLIELVKRSQELSPKKSG